MDINYYLKIPYKHLGRDTKGTDCFGLVKLFYENEFKIVLKDYVDYDENWWLKDSELIIKGAMLRGFKPIDGMVKYGDVLLFEEAGFPKHVGIVYNSEYFLHTSEGGTACHSYVTGRWSTRILETYRHKELQ